MTVGAAGPSPAKRGRWPRTVRGRQRLLAAVLLSGAAGVGYLITVLAYPAPLIVEDHAVARVLGLPTGAARAELEGQGFRVRVEEPLPDPVIPAGRIVWQDPPSETILPGGSPVRITPSAGPAPASVPDVAQFELEQGRQIIEAAGFRVGRLDTISSRVEAGIVVSTRPTSGTLRPPGSAVDVIVSSGPADIRVPAVVGLTHEDARLRLESAGLRVGTVRSRDGAGPPGIVLDQQPAAGILSPKDARVNLVVSGDKP